MKQFLLNSTLDDLVQAIKDGLTSSIVDYEEGNNTPQKHYVYGYAGLKTLLGCSDTTIWRLLKSHVLDAAVSKRGKIIVADADLVLDLLTLKNQRRRGIRGGYRTVQSDKSAEQEIYAQTTSSEHLKTSI